jgi:hypothetical protein
LTVSLRLRLFWTWRVSVSSPECVSSPLTLWIACSKFLTAHAIWRGRFVRHTSTRFSP